MVGVLVVGSGGGGGGSGRFSGRGGLKAHSFRDPPWDEEEKEEDEEDEGMEVVVGWGCPHNPLGTNYVVCMPVCAAVRVGVARSLMCLPSAR